jgi:hypothetical protein
MGGSGWFPMSELRGTAGRFPQVTGGSGLENHSEPPTVQGGVVPVPPPYKGGTGPRTPAGNCIRGPAGARTIPDRHAPGCELGDCPGCQPCPHSHCTLCHRAHADVTCPSCQALARLNLAMIGELASHLPAHAVLGRQAFHTHEDIPGGDATVMMTPASPSWAIGSAVLVTTELPNDVRPPLDVLTYWTRRWETWTSAVPSSKPPTLNRAGLYLARNLHLMAATRLFVGLAHDLSTMTRELENVLHAGDRPDVSRVPCWDCGSRLQKVWADQLQHDHWRCPTCGELYDQGRYQRAQHDQLASRGADRFVPLMDAVAVTGRPEQTIRSWVSSGLVETRRLPAGGREVWWPDVRDRHRITPLRARGRG